MSLGQNLFISWFTGFFSSDLGVGGGAEKKALKMTSQLVIFKFSCIGQPHLIVSLSKIHKQNL